MYENRCDYITCEIQHLAEVRAKAIDEFAEECKKRVAQGELYDYVRWCNWNNSVDKWFDRIAEQLKGGAE